MKRDFQMEEKGWRDKYIKRMVWCSSFRGGSSLIREFLALRIPSRVGCGILTGSSWVDRPRL